MKIDIKLSEQSIDEAIKKVKNYKKWVDAKTKMLIERLALIGAQEAAIRFASAQYDGTNDAAINVAPIANGWVITASGQSVCFIEFGSGVYHNSSEPYPLPRPVGIVGIGEYDKGRGKQRTWGYYGNPGTNGVVKASGVVLTHGNPAAMPMWYALKEMERNVLRIAREVFNG